MPTNRGAHYDDFFPRSEPVVVVLVAALRGSKLLAHVSLGEIDVPVQIHTGTQQAFSALVVPKNGHDFCQFALVSDLEVLEFFLLQGVRVVQ